MKIYDFDDNHDFITKYEYDYAGNITMITYPNYRIMENLILSNGNLENNEYLATSSISAGSESHGVTVSGTDVVFRAENEINLLPGFSSNPDFEFTAQIGNVENTQAKVVTYEYDRFGRQIKVGNEVEDNYYADYRYNLNEKLDSERLNPGQVPIKTSNTYQVSGRLINIAVTDDGVPEPFEYFSEAIEYAPNGNITNIAFADYTYDFTYDNCGRLTFADHDSNINFDYSGITYDANGNFLSLTKGVDNKNYSYYSGTDRVKNTNGSTSSDYLYDSNGNIESSLPKSLDLEYDKYSGKTTLINIDDANNSSLAFVYNNLGERVYKEANLQDGIYKTAYIRGLSDRPLMEVDESGLTTFYIYSPTGLICKIKNDNEYYLIKDHLGSTREVFNSQGVIVSSYSFDAFGNLMNSMVSEDVAYQYTGQESDDEIGLLNYRARFYDSDLMRFYAVDPQWQTASPYLYCGNSPLMYTDPDGEWFGWDDAIVAAVGFTFSYVGYGITTGEWGEDALVAGAIGGASTWLGYNSGGLALNAMTSAGAPISAITTASSAAIGRAVGGAAGSIGNQLYSNGEVNWSEVGISAGVGAVGGFIGGLVGSSSESTFLPGILGSGFSGALVSGLSGELPAKGFARSAGLSIASSYATRQLYNVYGKYKTNKYFGDGSYGTDIAPSTSFGIDGGAPNESYACREFVSDFTLSANGNLETAVFDPSSNHHLMLR